MPRFFVNEDQINNDIVTIIGDDAHHISRSLRMAVGENITICDGKKEYCCILENFSDNVIARIVKSCEIDGEMPCRIKLFQALPKGDKLDMIIQKSVECGVFEITTFESERCIVRSKADSEDKKLVRRERIAIEAAKQCGRGIVPKVNKTLSFDKMLDIAAENDLVLLCYEGNDVRPLGAVLSEYGGQAWAKNKDIAIIIGPEGGFSENEVQRAKNIGAVIVGLGNRILRTETASTFVLSCLVYEFELQ